MGKYQQEAAQLLELVGGKAKHCGGFALHDTDEVRVERSKAGRHPRH